MPSYIKYNSGLTFLTISLNINLTISLNITMALLVGLQDGVS